MEVCLICTNVTIDKIKSVFDIDNENNMIIKDILFDLNYNICVEETGIETICYKCYMNLLKIYSFRDACCMLFDCEESFINSCQLCSQKTNKYKLFGDSALRMKSLTILEMLSKICSYDFSIKFNGTECLCSKCYKSCIENYMFHLKCEKAYEYWTNFILTRNNEIPKKSTQFNSHFKPFPTLTKHKNLLVYEKFKCLMCPKEFSTYHSLKVHLREHNGDRVFYCYMCMKGFLSKTQLINHVGTHTGIPTMKKSAPPDKNLRNFLCEICSRTFTTKGSLKDHKRVHSDNRPHKCHLCPKAYKSVNGIKRHMLNHTGKKPYMCEKCSKTFKDLGCLKVHYASHSDEYLLECDLCFRKFKHKNTLFGHKRAVHIGERRYPCEICAKAFTTRRHLDNHKQTHNTEKSFKCDLCTKVFLTSRYLTRHVHAQHSGRRKYHKCEFCSKEFTTFFGLKTHLTNKVCQKTFNGLFRCEICSKDFKQIGRLRTHQQEAHFRTDNV